MAHEKTKSHKSIDLGPPPDVRAIRKSIREFLDTEIRNMRIGNARFGVYVFYDYDGEPIYVGQTYEGLRSRIGRHLTNQRTDAVAMNVLDPFEVAEIEVWPLWELENKNREDAITILNSAEFTVFQKVIQASSFKAVLNEKSVRPTKTMKLPPSHRGSVIPQEIYAERKHPDTRIARRASTIASLARVISERNVQPGLRRTLVTQAKRLEKLASERLAHFAERLRAEDAANEGAE